MKQIFTSLTVIFSSLILLGCQSPELSTHDKFSKNINLPRNLPYGGFYCSNEYSYYAVYHDDHFVYWGYLEGGVLKEISADQIPERRKLITYLDESLPWSVLEELFDDLSTNKISSIHIAYESDQDCGTSGGSTFVLKSSIHHNFKNIVNLKVLSDGSIIDLETDHIYPSDDYAHLMWRDLPFSLDEGKIAVLIKGSEGVSVGDLLKIFNSLNYFENGVISEGIYLSTQMKPFKKKANQPSEVVRQRKN